MRVLLVHPGPLMYSEIYLRLEPLGLERVAAAVRAAGHEVRLLDLQIFRPRDYFAELDSFKPAAVGFSLNYLANVPEVLDLAKETRRRRPQCFLFAGGHSVPFIAPEVLDHAAGALDCVVRGEGEVITPRLLEAIGDQRLEALPGIVTRHGAGPAPTLLENLDSFPPARDLARHRRRYFIGVLDPCASAELTRGCPWDCSFCSAWTFYGRSYRKASAEAAAEDLARIEEPHVFLVDDVAFIHPEHGFAIGQELERRRVRKRYYLETRCDVLLRHPEAFAYWTRPRLEYVVFDVQHAVLPTRLPLRRFYEELVRTQAVINKKHLGWAALREVAGIAGRLMLRGQTNFVRSLWKFSRVYSADRQCGDHARPVTYAMRPPAAQLARPKASDLFVHRAPS